jgi:hypothetical protein
MEPKYPDITIQLTGEDGNAFYILGKCHKAMVEAGLREEYATFREDATNGDYNHLLTTVMRWFKIK